MEENVIKSEENMNNNLVTSRGGGGTYEDLNPEDPYNENNSFKPAFCVNLKTGDVYAGGGKNKLAGDGSGWLANKGITWDRNGDNINFRGFLNGAIRTPVRIYPAKGLNYLNIFKEGSNDFFIHISPGQSTDTGLTLPSSSEYIGLSLRITLVYAYGTYGTVRIVPEDSNVSNLYMRWRNKKVRNITMSLGAFLELRGVPRFDSNIDENSCDWVIVNASDYNYSVDSEGTPKLTNIVQN